MTAGAKRSGAAACQIAALAMLFGTPAVQANTAPSAHRVSGETVQARFDPAMGETHVLNRVSPDLCFFLSLPQDWRLKAEGGTTTFEGVSSGAELQVSLRSAQELQDIPQPDLARRDAAFLQRDYEGMLGRPAQSVSLTSAAPGATRWSATWIDPNLPSASRALTVETFIVPLSGEWVLEMTLANIDSRDVYDALADHVLSGLKVRAGAACRG